MRVRSSSFLLAMGAVMALAVAGLGQQVKQTSAPPTSAASGQDMYVSYCASCHGTNLKGGGPAAAALKVAPTDLTTLARRHGGQFPTLHVSHVIAGEEGYPAHGSKDMPVWGPTFRAVSQNDKSVVMLRIDNLTKYIEAHQVK
jgi:mono/diheme cytochrome c family protein